MTFLKARSINTFRLEPQEPGTKVTWRMDMMWPMYVRVSAWLERLRLSEFGDRIDRGLATLAAVIDREGSR
jgi:hypothetical protein